LFEVNLAGFWFFEPEDDSEFLEKKKKNQVKSKIFVPGYWDDYGFSTYDGKATYSTKFKLPQQSLNEELYLVLGYIDDIDVVYLNGEKIGSVKQLKREEGLSSDYFRIFRSYAIPGGLLNKDGDNHISVVVYDEGGGGGIYEGPIGIATKENNEFIKQRYAERKSPWDLILESLGF
jgi:sialate O-acetylesterase